MNQHRKRLNLSHFCDGKNNSKTSVNNKHNFSLSIYSPAHCLQPTAKAKVMREYRCKQEKNESLRGTMKCAKGLSVNDDGKGQCVQCEKSAFFFILKNCK